MRKNWRRLLLVAGSLLLLASFVVYLGQVASCYPTPAVWLKFSALQQYAFRKTCNLSASALVRFAWFLGLFVPGAVLFSLFWLLRRRRTRIRPGPLLDVLLVLMMADGLFAAVNSLIGYPVPGNASGPADWVVELIAGFGFLVYLGSLVCWYRKRWGVLLFEGLVLILAVFLLLAGGAAVQAASLILGGVLLGLLVFPVWKQLG